MADRGLYRWLVLVILFLNVAIAFGGMNIIAPLASEIGLDMGITLAQVGAAISFFTIASPIFSPVAGILVDKFGARWVLAVAGMVVAIAGAGRCLASDANQIIALMFVGGLGFACVGPVIPKALSSVFSADEFGKANGIVFAGFWVGSSLAFALSATYLSPLFGGWRGVAIAIGVMSGVSAVLWALIFRESPAASSAGESGGAGDEQKGAFGRLLRMRDLRMLSLFYACCICGLITVLALLPKILEDRGLEQPGILAALFTGAMVVSNVLGGMLSDRFGRRRILVISALLFAVTIPGILVLTGVPIMVCLVLAGLAVGPIIPVSTAIPVEMPAIGPSLAGTALGVLFMIGNLGGFFGPIISGWLIDTTGTNWSGFGLLVVLLLIAPLFLMNFRLTEK